MSGLILPGQTPVDLNQHRSRSQREIDGLRTLAEQLGLQNKKVFYLLSALVKRYGPVVSVTLDELNTFTDTTLCGFAVSKETGEVTLYTADMAPVIQAALRADVLRKQVPDEGAEQPTGAVLYEVKDEALRKQSEELLGEKPEEEK